MCVRASVVLMQCTLAHHVKFVRASCVNFHTLPNSNQGQIRSNLISHVFILNTNFNGHQFLVAKSALNGRNANVFALRFCGPPSWMRERVRSRIKSRPSEYAAFCHSVCCCFLANRQRYKQSFLGQVRHFLPGASSPHGEHAPMEWRTYPTNCQGIQIGMHTQVRCLSHIIEAVWYNIDYNGKNYNHYNHALKKIAGSYLGGHEHLIPSQIIVMGWSKIGKPSILNLFSNNIWAKFWRVNNKIPWIITTEWMLH